MEKLTGLYLAAQSRIASLEAENARLKAEPKMKWVKASEKFPKRKIQVLIRFSNDGIEWDKEINDYFYLITLSQKGFKYIEWLDEQSTEPVFTLEQEQEGRHIDYTDF